MQRHPRSTQVISLLFPVFYRSAEGSFGHTIYSTIALVPPAYQSRAYLPPLPTRLRVLQLVGLTTRQAVRHGQGHVKYSDTVLSAPPAFIRQSRLPNLHPSHSGPAADTESSSQFEPLVLIFKCTSATHVQIGIRTTLVTYIDTGILMNESGQ